jgi:hypothetical protein
MTKTTELAFLVRVDNSRFVVEIDGREIRVTDTPSFAEHLTYTRADQITQSLRKRGFRQALVCSHLGVPVTANDLRAALHAEQVERDRLPANQTELDKLPTSEIRRRTRTDSAFRARVEDIEAGVLQ